MNNKSHLASCLAFCVAVFSSAAVAQAPAPQIWKKQNGKALDIGASTSNQGVPSTIYIVGTNNELYVLQDGGFAPFSGPMMRCVRVDVDPNRQPWCVTPDGGIQRQVREDNRAGIPQYTWPMVKAPKAKDLGIGGNGVVWLVGADSKIHRSRSGAWEVVPGSAERIDVDATGNAWIVDARGDVSRFNGTGFQRVPGVSAVDVGIGGNGAVFVTGKDGYAYKWTRRMDNKAWEKTDGLLVSITADNKGHPLGVNAKQDVFFLDGPPTFRLNITTKGRGKVKLQDGSDCSQGCRVSTDANPVVFYAREGTILRWEGVDCATRGMPHIVCGLQNGDDQTEVTAVFAP